jgi:hypothetical protein
LDERLVHLLRAHHDVQFREREVEDVFRLAQHVGLHQARGLGEQGGPAQWTLALRQI